MVSEVLVQVHEPEADEEELERLAVSLRRELEELDVDGVRPVSAGPAPEGARAVDAAAVGALLVAFSQSFEAIGGVVATIRSWIGGSGSGRTVELTMGEHTLKLTAASAEQQDRLVEEFLRAVTRAGEVAGTVDEAGGRP
jgi:hypothetical protein